MPFYHCIAPIGVIKPDMRQEIVDEITRIHCEATGGLPLFVQVQFDEVSHENVFQNRELSSVVRLHVRMRAGRSAEVRHQMMTDYTNLLNRVTGVPIVDIMIGIIETSYENVMECGLRLPAPGDEESWKAQFAFAQSDHKSTSGQPSEKDTNRREPIKGLAAAFVAANSPSACDQLLADAASTGHIPGVVAMLANRDGRTYEGAFGKRSLIDGTPMTVDTVFWIASMTKAVTAVAAMQCIEQGRLSLDQPAGELLPQLRAPQVLEGFDEQGRPLLRPAKQPITMRKLLNNTAGFVYEIWNANMARYLESSGLPPIRSGKRESLNVPLVFEPGEKWEYGTNFDWAGLIVEAVSGQSLDDYMREHIFAPLGMVDTGFAPSEEQIRRLAQTHARKVDGSFEALPLNVPGPRDFSPGGGGLFSTGNDYMIFLQMLLREGSGEREHVLRPESVALMRQNQIGNMNVQMLHTQRPSLSNDVEFFPAMMKKWGLMGFTNTEDAPGGRRSAGSVAWAGLFNTYFWLDPKREVIAVFLTQVLPFGDEAVLKVLDEFEAAAYRLA